MIGFPIRGRHCFSQARAMLLRFDYYHLLVGVRPIRAECAGLECFQMHT